MVELLTIVGPLAVAGAAIAVPLVGWRTAVAVLRRYVRRSQAGVPKVDWSKIDKHLNDHYLAEAQREVEELLKSGE